MRNQTQKSDWMVITLSCGKTMIARTLDFGEDNGISVEEAYEIITDTRMIIPWCGLVDNSTIDIDPTGSVIVHFQNMGATDRDTYEGLVQLGRAARDKIKETT